MSFAAQNGTDPRPKDRVVGSSLPGAAYPRSFNAEAVDLHQETFDTSAKTMSGDLYWLSKDPIGIRGGLNQYAALANNPVNFVDPLGLETLTFDGANVTLADDDGNPIGTYPATSGRPGVTDPSRPWLGPIPEGTYLLRPWEIGVRDPLRRVRDTFAREDWGGFRVPLHPRPGTETFGRTGFFLHGGRIPGSAGCIDVGDSDDDLFQKLQALDEQVFVIVDYPDL